MTLTVTEEHGGHTVTIKRDINLSKPVALARFFYAMWTGRCYASRRSE